MTGLSTGTAAHASNLPPWRRSPKESSDALASYPRTRTFQTEDQSIPSCLLFSFIHSEDGCILLDSSYKNKKPRRVHRLTYISIISHAEQWPVLRAVIHTVLLTKRCVVVDLLDILNMIPPLLQVDWATLHRVSSSREPPSSPSSPIASATRLLAAATVDSSLRVAPSMRERRCSCAESWR